MIKPHSAPAKYEGRNWCLYAGQYQMLEKELYFTWEIWTDWECGYNERTSIIIDSGVRHYRFTFKPLFYFCLDCQSCVVFNKFSCCDLLPNKTLSDGKSNIICLLQVITLRTELKLWKPSGLCTMIL